MAQTVKQYLPEYNLGGDILAGGAGVLGGALGTIPGVGGMLQKGVYGLHGAIDKSLSPSELAARGFGQAAGGIATGAATGNVQGAIKQGARGLQQGIGATEGFNGNVQTVADPILGMAGQMSGFMNFQNGGPIEPPATRQDSLNLLQREQEVAEYFKDYNPYKRGKAVAPENYLDYLEAANREVAIKEQEKENTHFINQKGYGVPQGVLGRSQYRKQITPETFSQRDLQHNVVDISAPIPLYDTRITPTSHQQLIDPEGKDLVDLFRYDPLAITPWDMLDESQQEERLKKYGKAGTPFDTGSTFETKGTKPKSESSLARQAKRDALTTVMKDAGFTGYKAREVLKEGSEANKAWRKFQQENITPLKEQFSTPEIDTPPTPEKSVRKDLEKFKRTSPAFPTYKTKVDSNRVLTGYDQSGRPVYEDVQKRIRPEDFKSAAAKDYFAYGGKLCRLEHGGPVYEAEGGEVVDGGIPTAYAGGQISPNSQDSAKINGNSHAQGGVQMSGGERVFSDKLYVDKNLLKDLEL